METEPSASSTPVLPGSRQGPLFWVVTGAIKQIIRLACVVDDAALARVPTHGPLIVASNHINWLEGPVMYTHLSPRHLTGLAKSESWDNPALGWLFNLWGIIPLRRGEADMAGLRAGIEALAAGKILAIAPEGTRSHHGRLGPGHPGVVTLALHAGAPVLPVVHWGGEQVNTNLRQLRRTPFHIRVGKVFNFDPGGQRLTRPLRQAMLDELMYQLAVLLPPEYRGVYSDLSLATTEHLRFSD